MSRNRQRRNGEYRSQRSEFQEALSELRIIELNWLRRVEVLALNRFKWTNLPETVDERFIEKIMFSEGRMVWYDAGNENILCTKMTTTGEKDLYDNPTGLISTGNNGHRFEIPKGEGVVMYDSRTRTTVRGSILNSVINLAKLEQIMLINRNQQRIAKFISVPAEAQTDAKILQQNIDAGKPFEYIIDGGMNFDVATIDLTTPYQQAEFNEDMSNSYNRILSQLGIKFQSHEKSQYQRLEEVMIADDEISRVREDSLNERRVAAKLVNEKFGLDIKVDWNNDMYELLSGSEPSAEESVREEEKENIDE